MKRTLSLVALLAFVLGAVVSGCSQKETAPPPTPDTNAVPATPTPTNAP
jgi:hypothetical protein